MADDEKLKEKLEKVNATLEARGEVRRVIGTRLGMMQHLIGVLSAEALVAGVNLARQSKPIDPCPPAPVAVLADPYGNQDLLNAKKNSVFAMHRRNSQVKAKSKNPRTFSRAMMGKCSRG